MQNAGLQGQQIANLAKECIAWYELNKYPRKTVINLRNFLGRFLLWLENRELSVCLCKEYTKHLQEKGLRHSSISSDIGRLKMFLVWLHDEKELLDHNWAGDIKRPKLRVPEEAFPEQLLSPAKIAEYIDIVTTPRSVRPGKLGERDAYVNNEYREFLHFFRKIGLRPGEAISMTPERVNLDGSEPTVAVWRSKGGKGGKWVQVGIPLDYIEPIRRRVSQGRWFDVSISGLEEKMKQISKLAGKKVKLYSIRKSVDTGLIDEGAPIMQAAEHQGHTVPIMQREYYKFSGKQSSHVNNTYNPHIDRSKIPAQYTQNQIELKMQEWARHPDISRSYAEQETDGVKEAVYTVRIKLT